MTETGVENGNLAENDENRHLNQNVVLFYFIRKKSDMAGAVKAMFFKNSYFLISKNPCFLKRYNFT